MAQLESTDGSPKTTMALIVNGERIDDSIIEQEQQSLRAQMQRMSAENPHGQGFDLAEVEKNVPEWSKENVIERTLLRQEALKDSAPIPADEIDQAVDQVKKRYGTSGSEGGAGGEATSGSEGGAGGEAAAGTGESASGVAKEETGEKQEPSPVSDEDIRREVETRLRLDRLVATITAKASPPKNKDIAEFYRKNREQFKLPERVHAGHIVKHVGDGVDEETARAAVEEARQALEAGGVFEELADKLSDCPGSGGNLGQFPRGEMVEEFDKIVFEMAPGEVSPIFQTVFGFHIAKVYEHLPETMRPLAEVQEEIKKQLHGQKQNRAVENFVDTLRAKAEVREVAASTEETVAAATEGSVG